MRGGYQINVPPVTPSVKILLIVNLVIWFLFSVVLRDWVISSSNMYSWFGLTPVMLLDSFMVWQPFTYMFFHSTDVMHIVFNMLLLWWLGSELEMTWGRKFFLFYYIGCGMGAALIYTISVIIYALVSGNTAPLSMPVVGASGAVFGLMLAYGLIFGERIIYFFMIFPMKAKYFVMILGGIEVMQLLSSGLGSRVSNLSHLGGIAAGFFILRIYPSIRNFWYTRGPGSKGGRNLKLVIDNEGRPPGKHPRYWN